VGGHLVNVLVGTKSRWTLGDFVGKL